MRQGLVLVVLTVAAPLARGVGVEINVNVRHEVGGVSEFDRSKFITIHSSNSDGEWNGGQNGYPNFTSDLLADFILGNDVYFGRDTGYISGQIRSNIDQDPGKPGWARVGSTGVNYTMVEEGRQARNSYNSKTSIHSYENRMGGYVIGAQFQPFWPEGDADCGRTGYKWSLSTNDTPSEPFGSATGHYMGHFLNEYYASPAQVGPPLPTYVEVMNEPDWPLFEWSGDPVYGTATPADLWKLHNSVANQIHSLNTNVLVGGYCPAFPDLERDNFAEWQDEWVTFIDTCGTNMDFYAIHFYDIDQTGKVWTRRGSWTEAVFDMIEHYSQLQLGKQLPFAVTEYAGKDSPLAALGWSPLSDWKRIKSLSGYLLSFMDRPNLIGKTIPYIMLKQEPWARNTTTGIPGGARLMRQEDEAIDPTYKTGNWVYTEHVKWYRLWSDVKGTRVDIVSSDPDIQTDAYVSSNKAYLILNNLNTTTQTVDLALFENHGNTVSTVREKNLYWNGSNVVLDDIVHTGTLAQVQLGAEGTAILEYNFASPVAVDQTSDEVKYYASTYFQPISAGQTNVFAITNVAKGAYGEAVLRLGMGRDKARSKRPTVLFNGIPLIVPTDFMGHEGDDRTTFFGELDIPVPYGMLKSSNTVSVIYPDTGGYISSVALRAFEFSSNIRSLSYDIPIEWHDIVGSNLEMGFTNGPVSGWFSLLTKTNLLSPDWTLEQTELPTDSLGDGSVTNSIVRAIGFFRLVESDSPQPAPPPPSVTNVVEFISPDYANGTLNGQQNWNAESGWTVADAAGAGNAATPDTYSAAVLDEPIVLSMGETYGLSINFQFGGSYSTPSGGFVYTFLGGLKPSNAGASVGTGEATAADANIQIFNGADTYRLLNNYTTVSGASNISTGQLNAGDILQFDYELTMGADAASTYYTVRLQNLTDGTDTGTGLVNGIDASVYSALAGSGAYGFFQSIDPGAWGSGLSGVQVNAVTIH